MKKRRIAGQRILKIILLTAALSVSGCGHSANPAVPEKLQGNQPGNYAEADDRRDHPETGQNGATDPGSPGTWSADGDGWTSENGSFRIPVKEADWYVEEDEENNLFFSLKADRRVILFLSEWEDMELPSSFDFETYLNEYAKGILKDHPGAKVLRMETPEDARGIKIGITETEYGTEESLYHVNLALVPKEKSVLVFTMMSPHETAEKSTDLFDEIVKNIQFLK